jgi:hypothetical protein
VRCWLCGVVPLSEIDTSTLGSAFSTSVAGRWPAGDHEHAERPPTPAELEQAGHEALIRIRNAASTVA